jgi:molybdate transport system substrate-binding protein
MRSLTIVAVALVTGLLGASGTASAAEITILTSSGSTAILKSVAAAYEQKTGNKVNVSGQQSQKMDEMLKSNAPADLVAKMTEQFDELIKDGKVVPGTVAEYARAGNGVAVKAGSPKPDISTPEAFKQTMLNAKSIGHTNNGTGPANTRLFKQLGIYDQIKDKIKIIEGRPVGVAVAAGDVEIGIQQASVIMLAPGADFLGALPKELTEYSNYALGVLTVSKDPEAARAFVKFATSSEVMPILQKVSMEGPAK